MSRSNTALLSVACWLLASSTAWSAEIVRSIRWQELPSGSLKPGQVVATPPGATEPILRVVHDGRAPATFPLVTIERPGVAAARYALRGRVRYESVATGSYLEMWNHLPEGAFFSRSLDRSGPMSTLEGSSEWRAFVLPFFNREGGAPPEKLVFNLVLTGPGTVEVGNVELVQFAPGENPLDDSTAWWNDRQAGVIGAVAGVALGLLGTVIGWLGSTARARGFVLSTLKGIAWLGVCALLAGLFAAVVGQPYAVSYSLILFGIISAAIGFSLPRSLSKRYEQLELRRMQALDA
jgi:hypothetical protein